MGNTSSAAGPKVSKVSKQANKSRKHRKRRHPKSKQTVDSDEADKSATSDNEGGEHSSNHEDDKPSGSDSDHDSDTLTKTNGKTRKTVSAKQRDKMDRKNQRRQDDPNDKVRPRDEMILEHRYIDGIRCIEGTKLYTNMSYLGGYLGKATSKDLESFMDDNIKVFKAFANAKNAGFGVPKFKASSSVKAEQCYSELRTGLAKNDATYTDLQQATFPPNTDILTNPVFAAWASARGTTNFARAVYLATCFHLIKNNAETFPESHAEDFEGVKWGWVSAEDMNRAFCALRFALSGMAKGGYTYGTKPSVNVRFLTDEEVATFKSGLGRPRSDQIMELRKEARHFFNDAGLDADNHNLFINPDSLPTPEETVKGSEVINEKLQDIAKKQMAQKHKAGPGSDPNFVNRPPLSEDDIKEFLLRQAGRVEIVHDKFSDVADGVDQAANVAAAERHLPDTDENPLHPNSSHAQPTPSAAFWNLREDISTVSATAPLYPDACTMLGYPTDPKAISTHQLEHPDTKETSSYVPKPYQTMSVAWMISMERSPLRGGILGNDCGLGKTSTVFQHIFHQGLSTLQRANAGKQYDARPTYIVVPPNLIDSWFNEWSKYWSKLIPLLVFYGDEKNDMSASKRSVTLPSDATDALRRINKTFPPTDPLSAFGVVLSAYDTSANRLMVVRGKSKAGPRKFSHQVPDRPTYYFGDMVRANPPPNEEARQKAATYMADRLAVDEDDKAHSALAGVSISGDDSDDEQDAIDIHAFDNIFKGVFRRVICDEGHKIKNPRTRNHLTIHSLFAHHYWIVTATPMINRVSDLLGYLNLFWRTRWLTDLEDEFDLPGDAASRYLPTLIDSIATEAPRYHDRYVHQPMFVFDPKSFAVLNSKEQLQGGYTTRAVLGTILSRAQLRWTMASKIKVGEDTIRPGDDVPMYWISAVEIAGSRYEKLAYKTIWEKWIPLLSQGAAGTSSTTGDVTETTADAKGLRDMRVHRLLSLTTSDLRLYSFLLRSTHHTAQDAQQLSEKGNDCGFTAYFYLTRPTPTIPNYIERLGVCEYLVAESPKLRYACQHIHDALYGDADNAGKLTIFVNWPTTQWHCTSFLTNLGVDFYTVWPGTPGVEKDDIYRRFNDPTDDVKILIVNLRSSAVGLNLQNACAKLLILDMPDNINILIQAIGRVHRLGQLVQQRIWLVCLLFSYDQWLWANAIRKMVSQIVGEANIQQPTFSQQDIERAMETYNVTDETHISDVIDEQRDVSIDDQAREYIRKLMGARSDRSSWRTLDLAEPHRVSDTTEAQTPMRRHQQQAFIASSSQSMGSLAKFTRPDPSGNLSVDTQNAEEERAPNGDGGVTHPTDIHPESPTPSSSVNGPGHTRTDNRKRKATDDLELGATDRLVGRPRTE